MDMCGKCMQCRARLRYRYCSLLAIFICFRFSSLENKTMYALRLHVFAYSHSIQYTSSEKRGEKEKLFNLLIFCLVNYRLVLMRFSIFTSALSDCTSTVNYRLLLIKWTLQEEKLSFP